MKLGIASADQPLARRLAWVTAARVVFLILLLTAIAFLYFRGDLSAYPTSLRILFATIAVGFIQGAAYAAILRSGRRRESLAYAQIVLDQLTWTAVVYVSGGATSGATSFYGLTCLVGAILVGLRGATVAAIVGLGAYAVLCGAFRYGWVLPPADQGPGGYALTSAELVYPLLVNTLGVTVVALLAGYLAERLRFTGGALEEATRRVLEAERLATLGKVAAGLAHEIRNPLGSIRGSIEMLRESPALSAEDRQLCDIIHREAARLNNLVGDMVDLSRPRAPRAEAVDVAAVAREVVALARRAERSDDVQVEYEGPERAVGRADGAQLRQVVWNLVRNAVQVSPAGTGVVVRVVRHDREVTLSVNDRGPGIPAAERDRIFDNFYTTRTHGTGIGLAVVRRIMDDHASMGARIAILSPAEGGACFQVTLSADVTGLRPSTRPPPAPAS